MSSPFVQTVTSSVPVRKYLQRLITKNTTVAMVAEAKKVEDPVTEIVRLQSAHLTGYNIAISSSLRDGPIRGQASSFAAEGWVDRAVLVVHGTNDQTVNTRYAPLILSLLPPTTRERSRLITFDGAGHDLTISHGKEVAQAMLEFFR
ncbi:hypothetical protein C0991_004176 [Blastosporella zonata]|nr:hypothetical protein C0991_004176 [Blastosporella zonata]